MISYRKATVEERLSQGDALDPPWYHVLRDGELIGHVIRQWPVNGWGAGEWIGESLCGQRTLGFLTRRAATEDLLIRLGQESEVSDG